MRKLLFLLAACALVSMAGLATPDQAIAACSLSMTCPDGQAQEEIGCPGADAFSLQAVEDLVDEVALHGGYFNRVGRSPLPCFRCTNCSA